MMRARPSLAACCALLAAAPAAAESWVRVGGDAEVGEFVDADSVRRAGDEVRFRREMRFAAPRPEGFDRLAFSHAASCRDRTLAVLAMSFHLGDHELMSSTFRDDGRTPDAAPPETPAGRALAYACDGPALG